MLTLFVENKHFIRTIKLTKSYQKFMMKSYSMRNEDGQNDERYREIERNGQEEKIWEVEWIERMND